jgi:DNA processing protein
MRNARSPQAQRASPTAVKDGGPKYEPPLPERVAVYTLAALIAGVREIVPDQQSRLGFGENAGGLRLWCAGDMSLVRRFGVAIVGTRKVSPEGAARSRRLARELAKSDVIVVSGLARGVDTEALTAAIEAGGRVIAVIGTPIDRAYPTENRRLQERIYREHLLISQFEPGRLVFPSNFPERNKLMAALTDATAIVEAGDTSGTLHQAAECVRLGRWLFIARNLLENASLQWPLKFKHKPMVRELSETTDILRVLPSR